jgi:diguanylate cyclase (GGDEF)-like protein
MRAKALKVLAVVDDRTILRQLSKFLNLVGYAVVQTTDPRQALATSEADRPDFLIVDAGLSASGGRELCRALCGQDWPSHVYSLLLVENPESGEMVEALEAGVDDFLCKPIVFGELLARLRAGARVLEYERRARKQAGVDSLTGLASRAALLDRIQAGAASAAGRGVSRACVSLDLDFFRSFARTHGGPAGDHVLQVVAETLRGLCQQGETPACFGEDHFCVLLPDASEIEATQFAERVHAALGQLEFKLGEPAPSITASFGVAAGKTGDCTPEELVERADEALQSAKRSGRDCVVGHSDLDNESKAWTMLAAPGKLFERTLARDVMTPSTLTIKPDEPVAQAAALLRQSRLTALPVVDENGKLVGLVSESSVPAGRADIERSSRRVRDVLSLDPPRYDEETTFAALMEFFTRDSRSLIVITHQDRPTGVVTRASLAALSEPLTSDSFAASRPYSGTSDYLLVAETCCDAQ